MAEAVSDQEVRRQLERLLRELGETAYQRQELEVERNRAIQTANDEYVPRIDACDQRIDALKVAIKELAKPRFRRLVARGTKTIQLQYGEISHRVKPASMKIDDEKKLRRAIWRRRLVKKLTKLQRTIDNKALKELLVANPDLKLPGVRLERGENIVIRPGKTKAEITVSVEAGSLDNPKED